MKMKNSIMLLCFLLLASFAFAGIKFEEKLTWKQIKEKAKRENKMIFFDAYASWCGPCKYMEKSIYTDEKVAAYFNNNFINVKTDMEVGEGTVLQEEFGVTAFPTFLFFSPEGKMLHKSVGAMDTIEFISLGKNATNPSKQYYTLKIKALKGLLTDDDFKIWATLAIELKDNEATKVILSYLNAKDNLLVNKPVAATALIVLDKLSPSQVQFIFTNKTKLQQLMEWDSYETMVVLYEKLLSIGFVRYEDNNSSVDSFLTVYKTYDKTMLNMAETDIKMRIAILINSDATKAASLWKEALSRKYNPLSIAEAATVFMYMRFKFSEEDNKQLQKFLENLAITSSNNVQMAWKYFLQSVVALNLEQNDEATRFAEKARLLKMLPKKWLDWLQEK